MICSRNCSDEGGGIIGEKFCFVVVAAVTTSPVFVGVPPPLFVCIEVVWRWLFEPLSLSRGSPRAPSSKWRCSASTDPLISTATCSPSDDVSNVAVDDSPSSVTAVSTARNQTINRCVSVFELPEGLKVEHPYCYLNPPTHCQTMY